MVLGLLTTFTFIPLVFSSPQVGQDSFYNYTSNVSSVHQESDKLINFDEGHNYVFYAHEEMYFTFRLAFDDDSSYRVNNFHLYYDYQIYAYDSDMNYVTLATSSGSQAGIISYTFDWEFTKEGYNNEFDTFYLRSKIDEDLDFTASAYVNSSIVSTVHYSPLITSAYAHDDVTNRFTIDATYFFDQIEQYIRGGAAGDYDGGFYQGYSDGYQAGYDDASEQTTTASTIFAGFVTVGLLPINVFLSILNFEVFGINIGAFVSALLTVSIIVILLRTIFGGKKDD